MTKSWTLFHLCFIVLIFTTDVIVFSACHTLQTCTPTRFLSPCFPCSCPESGDDLFVLYVVLECVAGLFVICLWHRCCKYKRWWSGVVVGLVPCELFPYSKAAPGSVHTPWHGRLSCVWWAVDWLCRHTSLWLWNSQLQVLYISWLDDLPLMLWLNWLGHLGDGMGIDP